MRQNDRRPRPDAPLVHGLTRYDTAFAGGVALALMGICVMSGAGMPLFLAAIGAGATIAAWRLRRPQRMPSLHDDEPSDRHD